MCCAFGEPILCVFFFISKVLTETLDAKMVDVLAGVTLFRQGTGDVPDDTVHAPTPADENKKLKEQRKYFTYDCIVLSSHIFICI